MPPPIVAVDEYLGTLEAGQRPLEERLPVDRVSHHELGATTREAPVVACVAEWSIESGRRDLKRVRRRHDIINVEHRAQIVAHARAVIDADAVFRRRRGPRSIEPDPQNHAARFTPELDVEDVEPVGARHPPRPLTNLLDDVASHRDRRPDSGP